MRWVTTRLMFCARPFSFELVLVIFWIPMRTSSCAIAMTCCPDLQAVDAGKMLWEEGFRFDIVFTLLVWKWLG